MPGWNLSHTRSSSTVSQRPNQNWIQSTLVQPSGTSTNVPEWCSQHSRTGGGHSHFGRYPYASMLQPVTKWMGIHDKICAYHCQLGAVTCADFFIIQYPTQPPKCQGIPEQFASNDFAASHDNSTPLYCLRRFQYEMTYPYGRCLNKKDVLTWSNSTNKNMGTKWSPHVKGLLDQIMPSYPDILSHT